MCHGPEKGSKYHLETVQTTFSESNNYYRAIFVKTNFFPCLKMHHFRGKIPKYVLTPQKETSSPIFKIAIFSKFFGNFMSHIIRLNAGKRIKHFLNFSLNRK